MVEQLTLSTFKDKIFDYQASKEWKFRGDTPALIDFYASWCGPCKAVAPILEELAIEYDGRVKIYKVDTEKEMELASMFGIRSIPSLLFIPKDGEPQMAAGALGLAQFKQAFSDILKITE